MGSSGSGAPLDKYGICTNVTIAWVEAASLGPATVVLDLRFAVMPAMFVVAIAPPVFCAVKMKARGTYTKRMRVVRIVGRRLRERTNFIK